MSAAAARPREWEWGRARGKMHDPPGSHLRPSTRTAGSVFTWERPWSTRTRLAVRKKTSMLPSALGEPGHKAQRTFLDDADRAQRSSKKPLSLACGPWHYPAPLSPSLTSRRISLEQCTSLAPEAAVACGAGQSNDQAPVLLMAGKESDSTDAARGGPVVPVPPPKSVLMKTLDEIPQELTRMILPGRRACMLREVSKALKRAVENARPAVPIAVKRVTPIVRLVQGMINLLRWCVVEAVDLSAISIGAEGAGRLMVVLRRCPSLALLNLGYNGIGAEGAGLLAAVLPRCPSLAHLDLGDNDIGAEGAGLLAAVLPECTSLAHLNLGYNLIGDEGASDEGAGLLAAVLPQCTSLAHLDLGDNLIGAGGAAVKPPGPTHPHQDQCHNTQRAEG